MSILPESGNPESDESASASSSAYPGWVLDSYTEGVAKPLYPIDAAEVFSLYGVKRYTKGEEAVLFAEELELSRISWGSLLLRAGLVQVIGQAEVIDFQPASGPRVLIPGHYALMHYKPTKPQLQTMHEVWLLCTKERQHDQSLMTLSLKYGPIFGFFKLTTNPTLTYQGREYIVRTRN